MPSVARVDGVGAGRAGASGSGVGAGAEKGLRGVGMVGKVKVPRAVCVGGAGEDVGAVGVSRH